ncbi:hypothetical protein KEM55_004702, partial [Ascosphaera atra]
MPFASNLILHGPHGTGKSTILTAILEEYAVSSTDRGDGVDNQVLADGSLALPYALVKCGECVTARHLMGRIVSRTIAALAPHMRNQDGRQVDTQTWTREMQSTVKCDHISQLPDAMRNLLEPSTSINNNKSFVFVLDGIDDLREGSPMLLAGLAETARQIPALTFVFVFRTAPRPMLLQTTGVPHVYFPPYTREESIEILSRASPDLSPLENLGFEEAYASEVYLSYLGLLYDVLIGPTASTLATFRAAAEKLWPQFVSPISSGERPPGFSVDEEWSPLDWDFSRLVIRNRALLRHDGEAILVHHLADSSNGMTEQNAQATTAATKSTSSLPRLPYLPTLLLTSAFLAAHIPPRLDVVFFSKYASTSTSLRNKRAVHRRRLKTLSRATPADDAPDGTPSKSTKGRRAPNTKITRATLESALSTASSGRLPGALQARPFTLERLLAITRAVAANTSFATPFSGGGKPLADIL